MVGNPTDLEQATPLAANDSTEVFIEPFLYLFGDRGDSITGTEYDVINEIGKRVCDGRPRVPGVPPPLRG